MYLIQNDFVWVENIFYAILKKIDDLDPIFVILVLYLFELSVVSQRLLAGLLHDHFEIWGHAGVGLNLEKLEI